MQSRYERDDEDPWQCNTSGWGEAGKVGVGQVGQRKVGRAEGPFESAQEGSHNPVHCDPYTRVDIQKGVEVVTWVEPRWKHGGRLLTVET